MMTDRQIKILNILKNKYFLTSVIFIAWLLLFDKNSLIDRTDHVNQVEQLQKDKIYYKQQTKKAKERMKELKTDKKSLEKYAREQFLMKRENEDVFVVIREEE
jgi:cell division protein FtsB